MINPNLVKKLLDVFEPKCQLCFLKPATYKHARRVDGSNDEPVTTLVCDNCNVNSVGFYTEYSTELPHAPILRELQEQIASEVDVDEVLESFDLGKIFSQLKR